MASEALAGAVPIDAQAAATPDPSIASSRLDSLDYLRGIAVLGILLSNILNYALPPARPSGGRQAAGRSSVCWTAICRARRCRGCNRGCRGGLTRWIGPGWRPPVHRSGPRLPELHLSSPPPALKGDATTAFGPRNPFSYMACPCSLPWVDGADEEEIGVIRDSHTAAMENAVMSAR